MNPIPEIVRNGIISSLIKKLKNEFPVEFEPLDEENFSLEEIDRILSQSQKLRWGLRGNLSLDEIMRISNERGIENFFSMVNYHSRIRSLFNEIARVEMTPVRLALKVNVIYDFKPPIKLGKRMINRARIISHADIPDRYVASGIPEREDAEIRFEFWHRPTMQALRSFDQKNLKAPFLQIVKSA